MIAKNGFRNEKDVASKFNKWKEDKDAQNWLNIMGYELNNIDKVKAFVLTKGYKSDVVVCINSQNQKENIQVKLVSNANGYNQIDKRWVNKYSIMWSIPEDIELLLKYFTGEKSPFKTDVKDKRRMFLNEFDEQDQLKIIEFFKENKKIIVSDILKCRGEYSAKWMLVSQKIENQRWILKTMRLFHIMEQEMLKLQKEVILKLAGLLCKEKVEMVADHQKICYNLR